jgi:CheY-like chemotaxis protein
MSRKILIVEDSCSLLEMLGQVLAARGWNPILAESGRKALYKLQYEIPNVILTDMRMPDMNGFELVATLKKHGVYRNIPILVATGYPAYVARQQCLLAGCDDFIAKPFAISALETCLNNLLSLEKPKAIVW